MSPRKIVAGAVGPISIAIAALVALTASTPALAGVTVLGSSLDEIVERQSAGMESAFFGNPTLDDPHDRSVAIHPVVGGYGSDGILSGLSGSWHTTRLVPWDVGASVGVLDLDITTWTLALSSGRQVWSNAHSAIALEGAIGYQFLSESSEDPTAVVLDRDGSAGGSGDDVLLDTFTFFHTMIHAVYTADVWFLRPMVDLGWVGTAYRLDGNVWDGRFPVTQGDSRDESGGTGKVTFGFGASLDIDRVILFGGVKVVKDAGLFQANLGFTF